MGFRDGSIGLGQKRASVMRTLGFMVSGISALPYVTRASHFSLDVAIRSRANSESIGTEKFNGGRFAKVENWDRAVGHSVKTES